MEIMEQLRVTFVITNFQNGLSVMHYTGNGQRHKFNMITDIRTVFWVISIDQAYSSSGFRYVLSDSTKHPHWYNNNNGKLFGGYSNTMSKMVAVEWKIENGTSTNQPTSLAILSVNQECPPISLVTTVTSLVANGSENLGNL